MTAKTKAIEALNKLRVENNLPPYDPDKLKMSIAEIEELILTLGTPRAQAKDSPPTTGELLRKLNVIRSHLDLPRLKAWKGKRAELEKQIEKLSVDPRAINIKHIPAHLAGGIKSRRAIDTSKTQDAIRKNDKRLARLKLKDQKDCAKRIAITWGFHATTVLDYMQTKNITRPQVSGEALAEDIRAYVKQREDAGLRSPQKRSKAAPKAGAQRRSKDSGSVTPGDIADALSIAPRAVRIKLRHRETDIPKLWRVADERWGFKPEHKADIVKFLKGDK